MALEDPSVPYLITITQRPRRRDETSSGIAENRPGDYFDEEKEPDDSDESPEASSS